MPQFSPYEAKTAIAPIVAKPAGMDCEAELFLGPDETTKVASSGKTPFVSTGAAKNVSLPITMPAEGTHHGYIDVFTGGVRFLAYILKKDVVIIAAPVEGFSFGTPVVTVESDFMMPGFKCAEIRCVVTNPSGSTQTRIVKCGAKKVIEPWKMGYRFWDTESREFPLTLSPGQSAALTSPSHWWDSSTPYWRTNYPAISYPGSQYYCWMEDDIGNKSIDVMFDRSGYD